VDREVFGDRLFSLLWRYMAALMAKPMAGSPPPRNDNQPLRFAEYARDLLHFKSSVLLARLPKWEFGIKFMHSPLAPSPPVSHIGGNEL